jgi:hemolysin activation/secretion protein
MVFLSRKRLTALHWVAACGLAGAFVGAPLARAQTPPPVDAGSLLQQQQNQPPRPAFPPALGDAVVPLAEPPTPAGPAKAEGSSAVVVVTSFKLTGSISVFTPERLHAALAGYLNRPLSLADLQAAARTLTELYRQQGYFLARAYLPKQDITEGIVTLVISEGRVDSDEGLRIEGQGLRLKASVVKGVLGRAAPGNQPLKRAELERGLLLLNDLPGIRASANLEPGLTPGTTRIVADVKEAPLFNGFALLDNYGSRYTGTNRASAGFNFNDPLGYGEQLTVQATQSQKSAGANYTYGRVGYSQPVGTSGARAGVVYSSMAYSVGEELANLRAEGTAQTWTGNARYPLIRSRERSLYATAAYDRKTLFNEAAGAATSDKLVDVATTGLDLDQSDALGGGGGYTYAGLSFSAGQLDLGRNAASLSSDQGIGGAHTQGSFQKLNWHASRLQRATEKLSFALLTSGQFTCANLDSAERFQLGGPGGVRAYPTGEAAGDEGVRASLEARYFVGSFGAWGDVNVQAFYDWGRVRQFKDADGQTLTTPNDYNLSGFGLGVTLSKSARYEARLQWAKKIGDNPAATTQGNDSDGTRHRSRVWVSLTTFF